MYSPHSSRSFLMVTAAGINPVHYWTAFLPFAVVISSICSMTITLDNPVITNMYRLTFSVHSICLWLICLFVVSSRRGVHLLSSYPHVEYIKVTLILFLRVLCFCRIKEHREYEQANQSLMHKEVFQILIMVRNFIVTAYHEECQFASRSEPKYTKFRTFPKRLQHFSSAPSLHSEAESLIFNHIPLYVVSLHSSIKPNVLSGIRSCYFLHNGFLFIKHFITDSSNSSFYVFHKRFRIFPLLSVQYV